MTPAQRGRLGGQATYNKYGVEHMRRIGSKGFKAVADKYFGGDTDALKKWLQDRSAFVGDPCPWNGAFRDPGPINTQTV